jgi:hypothetical protein
LLFLTYEMVWDVPSSFFPSPLPFSNPYLLIYFDPNPLVCFSNSPTLGEGFVLSTYLWDGASSCTNWVSLVFSFFIACISVWLVTQVWISILKHRAQPLLVEGLDDFDDLQALKELFKRVLTLTSSAVWMSCKLVKLS